MTPTEKEAALRLLDGACEKIAKATTAWTGGEDRWVGYYLAQAENDLLAYLKAITPDRKELADS
jgi:hypothetical protein